VVSLMGRLKIDWRLKLQIYGRDLYVKSLNSFEVGLYRSFDTPIYNFSLPISLRQGQLIITAKIYKDLNDR